jgi:glycosyl transferase family 87
MIVQASTVSDRRILGLWGRWHRLLLVASALMAISAAVWLGYEFWRLIWQPSELVGRPVWPGAIDLIQRYGDVQPWFAGLPVPNPAYPPASYVLLWPLLGWLPLQGAIILWAATSVIALGWLIVLAVRESRVSDGPGRLFVSLLPLSMYATGATIGNGQLIVHVLPMLLAGILFLRRGPPTWSRDVGGSALVLASLVKPTVSAPFFWIVTFTLGRWRPFMLVVLGYVVLTLAASQFRPDGLGAQLRDWLAFGSGSALFEGSIDDPSDWATKLSVNPVQYGMTQIGMQAWTPAASVLILMLLGRWVYRHRMLDPWLLLGVSALAARFWTYHRWYDDLLILVPMLTLLRLIHTDADRTGPAGWLLAGAVVTSLAPGGLFLLPPPWLGVYVIAQVGIWLTMLAYLCYLGTQANVLRTKAEREAQVQPRIL